MAERHTRSLRWRLLVALLSPLAALMAVNAWLGYDRAVQVANEAYDRSLYLAVRALAEDLQWQDGQVRVQMRPGTGYWFENHTGARLFYTVSDAQGQWLLGNRELPCPDGPVAQVHYFALVAFDDVLYRQSKLRLAKLTHVLDDGSNTGRLVRVCVAETRETRQALIQTILCETLGSQLVLLLAVAALVLLAVRLAVQPLQRLRGLLEAKADDDLRALPDGGWPLELQPLVRAINGYTQRLGRLLGIRKRFLDNAAHQLRTPLTALKTQLVLMQRQGQASSAELLQAALRTSDDAVRLTAQLLALTRAEHGQEMDKTAEVDLVALTRQVCEDHLWRAHGQGIDLGLEVSVDRVLIQGHALLLQEAVTNLIDNAMHHGGPGVRITVRVTAQGIEVEDNGPGIAPAHQPHVFERFYRAAPAGVSGSGLGLAIVQEIARLHGARAEVQSPLASGPGTCMRLLWDLGAP